ncbi:MAG: argininosuccinate synthase [Inquilinaceae bacterium]
MKIVLAYSGGLDTSIALAWLRQTHNADVIAFCANLGQYESFEDIRDRALKNGASAVHIEDLRDEFIEDYAFRALKADAVYEGTYHMAASLGRPLIAKKLVEIAEREGAQAVAHGATGRGNDQVRFYASVSALNPGLKILSPLMEWDLKTRRQQIDYARIHDLSLPQAGDSPYSRDTNLWGTSAECGGLDDIEAPPPDDVYTITQSPEAAPDQPRRIDIAFESGRPIALDGRPMGPRELVGTLNEIGGEHGIGRLDIMENRLVGIKVRGVYESPAAAILYKAHRELENLVLERDLMHFKQGLSQRYAELVYDAKWFSALRESLDAFFDVVQQRVSGRIALSLYKGLATVISRKSTQSLYHLDYASYELDGGFDQKAGEGFSYIWSMPARVSGLKRRARDAPANLVAL